MCVLYPQSGPLQKPTLQIHRPYSHLHQLSQQCLPFHSGPGSHEGTCIGLSCHIFSCPPIWNNPSIFPCHSCPHQSCVQEDKLQAECINISSWWDSGRDYLANISQKLCCNTLSMSHQGTHNVNQSHNLDHVVMLTSSRYLYFSSL